MRRAVAIIVPSPPSTRTRSTLAASFSDSTSVLARTRRRLMVLALFAILALWSAGLWWVFQRVTT